MAREYQPVKRTEHSSVRVGDCLYMWGGNQTSLPRVHSNIAKKSMCSVMEVCHLKTGRWEQKPTTGNPPLGVISYAAAAIGNEIFYFGGRCNHDKCFHNGLYSFNVDTFKWKELSPTTTDHGPMMKGYCDMVAFQLNGEDYLAVIGGYGPSLKNTPKQPGAQYSGDRSFKQCNEIHFYKLSSGQWISPIVTGDRPPPIDEFTLTSINKSSAILFGGNTHSGKSNDLYIFTFTETSVDCLKLSNPGGSVQWPEGRCAHSSVLINNSSGPHLLVMGDGTSNYWIFDIKNKSWMQLFNIPDNLAMRYNHSLSIWSVTPVVNWMIIFGGKTNSITTISDTAVIELSCDNNHWSTEEIPLDQYQLELQKRIKHWDDEKLQESQEKVELLQRQVETGRHRENNLEMQIKEAKEQGHEKEREVMEKEKDFMQQFQHLQRQLQQAQQKEKKRECEIQEGYERERQAREKEKDLQQQLQQNKQWLLKLESELKQQGQQLQQARERGKGLEKQLEDLQRLLQLAQQQEKESKIKIQLGFERVKQGKEREQHLQQQLQEKERELEQYKLKKEKEGELARESMQNLQQQLLEKERESEQCRQEKERDIQLAMEIEQNHQQYKQEKETQLQQARERETNLQLQLEETREKEMALQRQVEGGQEKEQDLQMQIGQLKQQGEEREQNLQQQLLEKEEIQRELEETRKSKQQLHEKAKQLEGQIIVAESSWVVNEQEITMTGVVLGKGGYGEVKEAKFRGLKVAAKCLYEVIISPYNIGTFSHEMNIASKIRHPNLVQFIGATKEGVLIILTELMQMSLRKKLDTALTYPTLLNISLDVACALNYLHLFKPHPILHRDVSSANVLLQEMKDGGWKAKVSDYGTVKLQHLVTTKNPGNPVYSAPESPYPRQHSPAMDVFSYGVLLIEMNVHQFPDVDKREEQIKAIKWPELKNIVERCLTENCKERPTMSDIIEEIEACAFHSN